MTQEEYYTKKEIILNKFNGEFIAKHYRTDPALHGIVELLLRDKDPYEIIERLIEDRVEMIKNFKEYMTNNAQPRFYKP